MTTPIKIASSILVLVALIGAVYKADCYVAKAEQLAMVERRLDQKIVQDQYNYIQEQLWKIEDRYRDRLLEKSDEIIDRERRLLKQLKETEEQLKRLKEK